MKDSEKIYDGITGIRDDLVEGAEKQDLKRKRPRRRFWFGAIAAALFLAMVGGYFMWPGGGAAVNAYAISEASYPEMAQYPNDMISSDGMPNSDGFEEAYEAWREDLSAQRNSAPEGYAGGLDAYFGASAAQFLAGAGGENRAYSPLNVYMALAMLAELTDGESRQQILSLLGSESIEALRQQANGVWNTTYRDDGIIKSILASSMWLDEDVSFNQDTMDTLAQNYYASSYRGEMGSADFNAALQDWINGQTGGLLQEQAGEEELTPDTIMALATTVYFRAKWSDEFNEAGTAQGVFHAIGGDVTADFMHSSSDSDYYWADNFSAAYRYLESGGRMWFILPDEGVSADELLQSGEYMDMVLDPGNWAGQKRVIVNYALPKFDIASHFDLGDGLKALGVTDVFDGNVSDFSPMTDMEGVFVNSARHGARVAIDEEGVTAAAFTELAMAGSAAPPDDEVDFTADRPFIFVITTQDDLPLFVGVVNNPA